MQVRANDLRMLGRHPQHVVSSVRGFCGWALTQEANPCQQQAARVHHAAWRRSDVAIRCARAARRQSPSHPIPRTARVRRALIARRDRVSSFVRCDRDDIDRGSNHWRYPHRRLLLVVGRRRSASAAVETQRPGAVTHDQRVHGDAPQTQRRFTVSFRRQRTPLPRLHGQPWPPWIIVSAVRSRSRKFGYRPCPQVAGACTHKLRLFAVVG